MPFSIAAWVFRPTAADEVFRSILVTDDEPGRSAGIWFQMLPTRQPEISFADGAGVGTAFRRSFIASNGIASNTWVHLVATVRSATDMTLYVNGSAVSGSYSGTGGPLVHTAAPARIGTMTTQSVNRPWLGRLDEVRVYSCSLSAAEVAALHTQR